MRARDLDRLTATPYDVLVIGGGIYGLALAYEAASRGLKTALVDAGDFGGATSFNHQKTVHGGLRSLQSGRIDRALESIRERRTMARIAPWLLRPLPFLVGTTRSWTRNRLALRAAFRIDRVLGRRRNDRVEPELHLPAPRLVSRAATLRLFSGIRAEGLTGGAQWYDYQIVESDRLTFAFAEAADRSGADLANYVEAVAAVRAGDRVSGMEVRDALTGRQLTVQARATINAAGRRIPDVMALFGDPRQVPMLKAMNLVTAVPASDMALAAPTAAGRMLTLVPWRGRALVGTSQSQVVPPGAQPTVTEAEVQAFIAEANSAFPALRLARNQVTLVHRGIVPAAVDGRGRADLLTHANPIDHSAAGARGAFSVLGLKYTTARGVAERTIDLVARQLGARLAPSGTASRPLPGAAIADHEALAIETARDLHVDVPLGTLRHLSARYAERAADIVRLIKDGADLCEPVAPGSPTIGAEIIHAIRHEAAHHLADIVIRRSGLGSGSHPGELALRACGQLAARELGWDSERLDQEVTLVDRFYQVEP